MTEQQYTCPKCFKNYTRFTIAEHYVCGVEPLGVVGAVKEPTKQEPVHHESSGAPTETAPTVETTQPADPNPAPKKRGPKPKVKAVA